MTLQTKKPINKRILIIIFLAFLLLIISILVIFFRDKITEMLLSKTSNSLSTNQKPIDVKINDKEVVSSKASFAALGDMIAHDTINANAATQGGYDYSKYFTKISEAYSDADIVFCNQESSSAGDEFGISGYPVFNAPVEFAHDLFNGAGCNVINLANNHMGDKGVAAINKTLDVWSDIKPYAVAGANKSIEDQNKVAYFSVNDIKFSFLAFADFNNNRNTPSYAVNIFHNQDLVIELVSEARQNSDFVIVSLHWGVEDSSSVSFTQESLANLLASLNVDVVIGTGPHVLQKVDYIDRADGKKMLVWYSLGNMLSSQLQINQLTGGIAKFDIEKTIDEGTTISNITFIPTYMHYEWSYEEAANYNLLSRKNVMIYLLKNADEPLSRSLQNTTVEERRQYVIETIGDKATVL
jgi:poly-gamma-glutamate capsule biosynthesis protein CapA/YwtB (metallophosphatase superfamily)